MQNARRDPGPVQGGPLGIEGFRLFRIFGVELRVDWSLTILFALVLFDLGMSALPAWHPEWSAALRWGIAVSAGLLFFASVFAHELSHALVARATGLPVHRITLFVFGGMAQLEREPHSAWSELAMAIVGPLVSIAIGIAATSSGLHLAAAGTDVTTQNIATILHSAPPLATLLWWLGTVNLMLGVFNLLPGFPLDGGRVFRALVWAITHDRKKATRWASGAGRGVAWALMALGVWNALGGAVAQGLWLLLIGWFLNNAARMTLQRSALREALEQVPLARVMRTNFVRLPPDLPVETLVHEYLMRGDQRVFPIERDGQLLGIVSRPAIRQLKTADWPHTPITQVMTPAAELGEQLPPDAHADQAFERLASGRAEELPVVEHGHLVGIVERGDLMRWIGMFG